MLKPIISLLVLISAAASAQGASYYTVRPDDPKAVYLTRDRFGVRGDGIADDSAGIQQAIDTVQETTNQGIVFIPEGRYRLSRAINVWPAIRLIGYGAKRPVFERGGRISKIQNLSSRG